MFHKVPCTAAVAVLTTWLIFEGRRQSPNGGQHQKSLNNTNGQSIIGMCNLQNTVAFGVLQITPADQSQGFKELKT